MIALVCAHTLVLLSKLMLQACLLGRLAKVVAVHLLCSWVIGTCIELLISGLLLLRLLC
jgi:hypothetical protein